MLRCDRVSEPHDFDAQVRHPGKTWLANNSNKVPKDYWSRCKEELADAFQCRCAYTAMRILPKHSGTVDHFLSKRNRPDLAYEWSNYRYATSRVNSCKANYDDHILDPAEIQNEWFAVQIPSLQLVLTDKIPLEMRAKAEFTLKQPQPAGLRLDYRTTS